MESKYKWVKRKPSRMYQDDDLIVNKLADIRGINNLEDWINPPSKYVHSPYTLDNIDEAVQKIVNAVYKGLKIVIVADIDVDGVCSTGIMYGYLSPLTDNVSYIHAQRSQGHGVETVVDKIDKDVDLIIIVDSSSNSVEGCRTLTELGHDIVVIDHHVIDVENPYATIVNCQLGSYKNKNLSGSGMCYKVCQVLDDYMGIDLADNFLDLTVVGIVGDMMSVKDMENRYLIYNGIHKIENIGIKEILKQSNIDFSEGINTTNISFKIAPIIGACSRFDKIELALELVTTNDEERAKELTKEMIEMNEKRKSDQKTLVESIISDVDDSNNIIIIVDNSIESGFRGLIATEVVERYSKPVFVLSHNDGKYQGSARSVGTIQLKEMCQDSGLFIFATGHSMAHGVGFKEENLEKIIDFFNNTLNENDFKKVVEYDLEIDVDEIDEMDIKQIEKFSKIVGQGFPEPTFKVNGIVVEEKHTKKLGDHVRAVMGKNNDTIKINCENDFALMKFRSNDEYAKDIDIHFSNNFVTELEVVGSLNLNKFFNWGTRKTEITKQIFISDYKII